MPNKALVLVAAAVLEAREKPSAVLRFAVRVSPQLWLGPLFAKARRVL